MAVVTSSVTPLPHQQHGDAAVTPMVANPLRVATYVHVADLISVYDIDHDKLQHAWEAKQQQHMEESVQVIADANEHAIEHADDPTTASGGGSVTRLQTPSKGFNLTVKVGAVSIVVDKERVDRSRIRLAEVEVGDETGTVALRARDEQIDLLQDISNRSGAVVLRNCTIELYKAKYIRLAITKWGKLTPYPDGISSTPSPPAIMNNARDYSKLDLSCVVRAKGEARASFQNNQPFMNVPHTFDTRNSHSNNNNANKNKQQQQQHTNNKQNRKNHYRYQQHGMYPMDQSYRLMPPQYHSNNNNLYHQYTQQQQQHMMSQQQQHSMRMYMPSSQQAAMMQQQYELQMGYHHHQMYQQQEQQQQQHAMNQQQHRHDR